MAPLGVVCILALAVGSADAVGMLRAHRAGGFHNATSVAGAAVDHAELLARVGLEEKPLQALIADIRDKAAAANAEMDPEMRGLNWRIKSFAAAIHHQAIAVRAAHSSNATKAKAKKVKKVRGDDTEYSEGHEFEHVADDKTCSESASMGEEKGVYDPKDCMKLCAVQPDCIAFAFAQKPYKSCEFYSQCTSQKDANVIRGFKLFALKDDDGEIYMDTTCGALPEYPNSRVKMWKGQTMGKSTSPFAFKAGDKVEYECDRDTNTDGSKDGPKTFEVECMEGSYFKPSKHGCVEKSECGPLPCLRKAHITGKMKGTSKNPIAEMVCDAGYSLDGEKVIEGGEMKNALLYVECDFAGEWSAPVDYLGKKGKTCEPFAFVPASGMIKMYNKVFEVLFTASCNKELAIWANNKEEVPPKLEDGTVCGDYVSDDNEGACKDLVKDLKDLFKDAKGHEDDGKFDAGSFCGDMWDLLKMEEPAAKTDC